MDVGATMASRKPKADKVPVTRKALAARINRALAKNSQQLRGKPGRPGKDGPSYYRLDVKRNRVLDTQVDVEALGRELGVLEPYERLADEKEG